MTVVLKSLVNGIYTSFFSSLYNLASIPWLRYIIVGASGATTKEHYFISILAKVNPVTDQNLFSAHTRHYQHL